ncbi:hypothetical protein [Streptomyces sp. SPB162]|uniref:hypothetical protein n=1 Tax=Streptomyces sp. SPB162 TaxID=2940560 RepID=UPI00240719B2|nr:hypothetical protein [Streptomyces sp. SPB162]MDF9812741.1 hypothetical protein [Streptomyces sp. SPB162]
MSSLKRRIAAGIGSAAIVVAGVVTLAPAANAAANAPAACSTSNAVTKKTAYNGSMYIELRYSQPAGDRAVLGAVREQQQDVALHQRRGRYGWVAAGDGGR